MGKAASALRSQERAFKKIKKVIRKALRICESKDFRLKGVYPLGVGLEAITWRIVT